MRRLSVERLVSGLFLGLALTCMPLSARADVERVRFETVDDVEIHGTYYDSSKGNKGPCALLIHGLGNKSEQEGWDDLAKKLQAKGFAVLTFDFRGHGESVNVGPRFWQVRYNQSLKGFRASKPKEQISYNDFTSAYHIAMLINDITAAKRYLDKRNDAGDCNSSNLIVVAEDSGAALATAWIWNEWNTPRVINTFPLVTASRGAREGQDISGAVYLSITPYLKAGSAKWTASVQRWLAPPVKQNVLMYFLYGDKDTQGAKYSQYLSGTVLKAEKDTKMELTGTRAIKDTKLSGHGLLGKSSLDTDQRIVDYAFKVADKKRGTNAWSKKDIDKSLPRMVRIESFLQ
jgi:alpha-beta hydrolase superfamily lysophospholipase